MKFLKSLLVLSAALATAGPVRAIQINWGIEVDSTLRDSFGNALNDTYKIQLGFFESVLPGVQYVPTASNVSSWASQWRVFDEASFAAGTFDPSSGYFTSSASLNSNGNSNSSYASVGVDFSNQEAYIWIHNTKTPGPAAQWFLGRSATASTATPSSPATANWILPPKPVAGCCDNEVQEWSISDLDSADIPVLGRQAKVDGPYTMQLVAIPEPSLSILLALGGVAAACRRRRTGAR